MQSRRMRLTVEERRRLNIYPSRRTPPDAPGSPETRFEDYGQTKYGLPIVVALAVIVFVLVWFLTPEALKGVMLNWLPRVE